MRHLALDTFSGWFDSHPNKPNPSLLGAPDSPTSPATTTPACENRAWLGTPATLDRSGFAHHDKGDAVIFKETHYLPLMLNIPYCAA